MKNDYIIINKRAYDLLASEYDKRTITNNHEIKDGYWYNILNNIELKKDSKVLEIGPGSGRNLKMLESIGCNTTAVELSGEMSKVASRRSPNSKMINKNILECQFEANSFDMIFLMAVIHNFPLEDAYKLLEKIYNWLANDGYLLIGTTIHAKEDFGYFVKEDYVTKVERYRYQYTKETFRKLLFDNKFKIEKEYFVEESIRNKIWCDMICRKD